MLCENTGFHMRYLPQDHLLFQNHQSHNIVLTLKPVISGVFQSFPAASYMAHCFGAGVWRWGQWNPFPRT